MGQRELRPQASRECRRERDKRGGTSNISVPAYRRSSSRESCTRDTLGYPANLARLPSAPPRATVTDGTRARQPFLISHSQMRRNRENEPAFPHAPGLKFDRPHSQNLRALINTLKSFLRFGNRFARRDPIIARAFRLHRYADFLPLIDEA